MKPLHHKTHTLAKRGLSLLCVLALCLGLLPTATLAAAEGAPNKLYVGDQAVIVANTVTYWTTDNSGGLTRVENATDTSNDWTVRYNPNTATLTLNKATITGSSDSSVSKGAGIYALCSSEKPVSLTIELIGENTITGSYGIYVEAQQGETVGTNASLLIKNGNDSGESGSLTVNGTSNHGIYIISGTGNASLTIKDASVVASSSSSYGSYAGVCVHSSSDATSSPELSLAVNGGSLTTSGSASGEGIKFYVGAYEATSATTSLSVTNNAIVDARNGGISASGVRVNPNVDIGSTGGTGGIVWNGSEGTVYGDVELQKDLEIKSGETLTIPEGSSLNCNDNLTNDGTILVSGGTVTGSLNDGTEITTPTISTQPKGQTVTEGNPATFAVTAVTASDVQSYQWQQSMNGGSNWTNIDGATDASYTIDNTTTDMSDYQYRCVVTGSGGVSVISQTATLTVQAKPASVPVTGVKLNTETLELFTSNTATLTAKVEPADATNQAVTWSSDKPEVATVDANGIVTAVSAGTATITATAADDSNISATCTVTVTDKTYTISADTTALDFGSAYTGYTQPAAQTVTLTNTGNQPVTLNQPVSTDNFEVGALSTTTLAAGETATFTIQPKENLPRGSYSEQITISGNDGASATLTASFTVKEPPYTGKYSYEIATDIGDNGAISVDRYATEGDKVTIDVTPDQAYKLDELVVTANGKDVELTANSDGTYTFTMPSADVRITATFAEDPDWTEPEEPATDVSTIFLDVTADAWYKDAVQYAYDNGLMTGVSANEFAPEQTTTRAMIVSMLARLEGVESANNAGFADVSNEWYTTAVNWAASVGVVNGYEDSTFRPNTAITREQLAAILMNYAQYKGQDVSARADLNGYTDQPSTWAQEAISWSVAEGLLTGVTADTLQPQGAATRAQVAAILQRFLSE